MSQTRLFVGNLPNNFKENELHSVFSKFAQVTNLDIKSKPAAENEGSKFAFVTISGANNDIEACIKHFSHTDFNGSKLYVTRARESFLERLQRERQENEQKQAEKHKNHKELSKKHPVIKLGEGLNPRKRKIENNQNGIQPNRNFKEHQTDEHNIITHKPHGDGPFNKQPAVPAEDKKKLESSKKRMESMMKKRQEFKSKQKIIKTGLIDIDKKPNKKLRFSDTEEDHHEFANRPEQKKKVTKNTLFDDDESDGEVNFEIKKQYEGKKGQKVLDLQSRYKSDKRFVLDERFIEEDQTEDETGDLDGERDPSEPVEGSQGDEKTKQIKILEDVLGVAIKPHATRPDKDKKPKPSMGMIRFDPMNPEHSKFVVPMEEVKPDSKKAKKKLKEVSEPAPVQPEVPKVEVSKEQFYKSEITKEAFEQPAEGFSLRSLFNRDDDAGEDDTVSEDKKVQDAYTPAQPPKKQKVKNPLDPGERNPFVYDSSESEAEDEGAEHNKATEKDVPLVTEVKAVWKENLFFSKDDIRLKDGLAFFNNVGSQEASKERRELKSVMKKRMYNTARKNEMFKKKIGGRKKSMKKSYKKKS
ncbi:probable RNA-binding protein CG14230 [Leguminivora glycinivorella]|uniref:probable RNA-binding protein CG14230 n=1 Tax=Leguminivora glycinivorella TaxID=1035111 RepID=UPI00200E7992|nr:probable RNA-binding protein CG14230 [Leguminivora glycinivorella]